MHYSTQKHKEMPNSMIVSFISFYKKIYTKSITYCTGKNPSKHNKRNRMPQWLYDKKDHPPHYQIEQHRRKFKSLGVKNFKNSTQSHNKPDHSKKNYRCFMIQIPYHKRSVCPCNKVIYTNMIRSIK